MKSAMRRFAVPTCAAIAAASLALAADAHAGGGPMNVVVLYNADVPAAVTVANHYAQVRSLPKGHLCGVSGLKETDTTIDVPTFKTKVQAPLDACIAVLPHPDLVDYVVLVRGLPYSVTLPAYAASLQGVVQVRHAKVIADGTEIAGAGQPGNTAATVANPMFPPGFAGDPSGFTLMNQYETWYQNATVITAAKDQPAAFHAANAPKSAGGYTVMNNNVNYVTNVYDWSAGNLVIVSALDGFDYSDATALVDRAAMSDGTFPTAEIMCMLGEDSARGARDPECEYATRMLKGAGLNGVFVTPFNGTLSGHTVAAYFTGSADTVKTAIAGNTFVPGAITDNLTSYGAAISNFFCDADGGTCPASESQTSIARFVRAGATGAHGTVNEPLNNVFPNAGALLLYTFGYSMGEAYFFDQRFLYWQNVYLGDPLATPYAERPKVMVQDAGGSHPQNQPIVVHATHPAGVASIDLFESGKRVAKGTGDTLSYMPTQAVGASLDLLAIAVANDAPVTRKGWSVAMQQPHAEVQGWTEGKVTLGPPSAGSEPTDDAGGTGPDGGTGNGDDGGPGSGNGASGSSGGCACGQAPGGSDVFAASGGALALVGLALVRSRRRRRNVGRGSRVERSDGSRGSADSPEGQATLRRGAGGRP